jgi:hypothetical protein
MLPIIDKIPVIFSNSTSRSTLLSHIKVCVLGLHLRAGFCVKG